MVDRICTTQLRQSFVPVQPNQEVKATPGVLVPEERPEALGDPVLTTGVALPVTTPGMTAPHVSRVFRQMVRDQGYPPDKVRLAVKRAGKPSTIADQLFCRRRRS